MYNVRPFRTKDIALIDILTESINNPIRFMWLACDCWFNVASVKRVVIILDGWRFSDGSQVCMAELRSLGDSKIAVGYRKSFRHYNVEKLLALSLLFAVLSSFFLAIFLIKYRVEYIVLFPFLAILFSWYFYIGLKFNSVSKSPEKIFIEKKFIAYVCLIAVIFVCATFIDFPTLHILSESVSY